MSSLYLFNLISQHNQWLSTRQSLIAGNIANANTPGFKTQEIEPFEAVLETTKLRLAATEAGHLKPEPTSLGGSVATEKGATWNVFHSGNNVSLEQELLKAGSVKRAYSLNTNVLKSFNRMLLAVAKGG
jgi:flagellar basal-body rod protein FlgB